MQMLFNFPPSLQGPMTVAPPSSPDPSVPAAAADEECFDIAVPSKVRVRVRVRLGPLLPLSTITPPRRLSTPCTNFTLPCLHFLTCLLAHRPALFSSSRFPPA